MIVRVPYDEPERRVAPRPNDDESTARLGPDAAYITTTGWSDPPDEYDVIDGDVYECDECGAIWGTEDSLQAHRASH